MEGPISFWGYKEQESNLILPEHDDDDDDDKWIIWFKYYANHHSAATIQLDTILSDSDHLEREGTLLQQAVKYKEVSSVETTLCTETEWSVCTSVYNRTMGVRGMTGLLRYKVSTLG